MARVDYLMSCVKWLQNGRMQCLIRVCIVCLNYRKFRVNETVLIPSSGPFSQPTLGDNQPTSAVSALIAVGLYFPDDYTLFDHFVCLKKYSLLDLLSDLSVALFIFVFFK